MFLIGVAARADSPKALSLRVGLNSLTAVGSAYAEKKSDEAIIHLDYSLGLDPRWRLKLSGAATISFETVYLGAGAYYHLIPHISESKAIAENVQVTRIPTWSPYIGAELGMSRVQLTLNRSSGGSDLVLGALIGPAFHAGTLYSLSPSWSLNFDGHLSYAISSAVAATYMGFTAGFSYTLNGL